MRKFLGKYSDAWPPAGGKPPTLADGLEFADSASGRIDAILAKRGVTVPVTAPASFVETLRDLAAMYAGSFIASALFPQAVGPASTTLHEWLMQQFNAGIRELRDGELPAGIALATTAGPRSLWTTTPTDPDTDEVWEPVFGRRKVLW